MRQTQRAMGQVSGYGNFVHLYLNGLYWGLYNATERPSAPFAAAHFGGEKEEWDALNSSEPVDGNKTAWSALQTLCTSSGAVRYLVDESEWNQVSGYLDIDNLIDYMLLNFYGGNQDWDDHNWYSARRRVTGAGYKFFSWDGERTLEQPSGQDKTSVNQADKPSRIYAALRGSTNTTTAPLNPANVEFRLRFADHVQKHMFANGPLTPAAAVARWNAVEAQHRSRRGGRIGPVGRQAARAAVHAECGIPGGGEPETQHAIPATHRQRAHDAPGRKALSADQSGRARLQPIRRQSVPGCWLTMTSPTAGTIYYTLDGSDPRQAWTATASGNSAVRLVGERGAGRR